MVTQTFAWLGPVGVVAAVMYVLDPADGRRRRAAMRDGTASAARRSARAARRLTRDVRHRAAGAAARLRRHSVPGDAAVGSRVRAAIDRVATHPGAIVAVCADGIVELSGPVLAREYDRIVRAVQRMPGVLAVVDRMSQHDDASDVPGLRHGASRPRRSRPLPLAICAACAGAAVLVYAAARRAGQGANCRGAERYEREVTAFRTTED